MEQYDKKRVVILGDRKGFLRIWKEISKVYPDLKFGFTSDIEKFESVFYGNPRNADVVIYSPCFNESRSQLDKLSISCRIRRLCQEKGAKKIIYDRRLSNQSLKIIIKSLESILGVEARDICPTQLKP